MHSFFHFESSYHSFKSIATLYSYRFYDIVLLKIAERSFKMTRKNEDKLPVRYFSMVSARNVEWLIDPLQAFLSASQDITSTKNMRPFLRELGNIAERTGAAMVIIGHMNKNDRTKGIYRGLGSIDITAAARSVLLVGKSKDDENIRYMMQIKNNLTKFGRTVSFTIGKRGGVKFLGESDISEEELLSASESKKSKYQIAEELITSMLSTGDKKHR